MKCTFLVDVIEGFGVVYNTIARDSSVCFMPSVIRASESISVIVDLASIKPF